MKCEEFESRLQDLLDRREAPNLDEKLDAHAGDCGGCRRVLSATNSLLDGLMLNDVPEPSESFTKDIVAEATSENTRRLPRAVAAISMLAVVAASLLLVLLPGLSSLLEPTNRSNVISNNSSENTGRENTEREEQLVQGNSPEFGSAFVLEDKASSSDADDELLERFGALDLSSFSDMSHQINSDQIPGVRPIKSSFTVAFDLIRRTIPGGSKLDSTAKPHAGAMLEVHPNHIT